MKFFKNSFSSPVARLRVDRSIVSRCKNLREIYKQKEKKVTIVTLSIVYIIIDTRARAQTDTRSLRRDVHTLE